MRVLVASDRIGGLGTLAAGQALGAAWAERGAQVAVAPLGDAGAGFAQAMADAARVEPTLLAADAGRPVVVRVDAGDERTVALEGGQVSQGIPAVASSAPLGAAVRDAVAGERPQRLYVDLSWALGTHDAGAGLLAALGATGDAPLDAGLDGLAGLGRIELSAAREALDGVELIGVVPHEELGKPLLGLRGISATRGFAAQLDLEPTMTADQTLESYARAVAPELAEHPDAGACGGAAFAVAALGGRIASGVGICAERARVAESLAVCDLLVAGCDAFEFHTRGGAVVQYLAEHAGAVGVPMIVVARDRMIGDREMRTFGVEAAYALELADPAADEVTLATAAVARTWSW